MSDPFVSPMQQPSPRGRLTLALSTILHAFTHAYGTLLVPLYLLIVADLKLGGVYAASLIVTVYGLVYCLGSYGAGVLADRYDRRMLLGVGLIGNAAAVLLMGLTRRYEVLLALGVAAGLAGTLFHPAANALIPAHFPNNPGMAIGLLGMGAGLGFFAGPQYAGWRATASGWHFGAMADWQRPCVEMGAAGLVAGAIFLIFARETPRRRSATTAFPPAAAMARERVVLGYESPAAAAGTNGEEHPPLGPALRWRVVGVAAVLGCRDFAGIAGLSLASIYLQKAHGQTAKQAGFVVGSMMLLSIVVNPLAVLVSPGRRRLPALAVVLLVSGAVVATVPYFPLRHTLAVLCAFQTCQLSSYAISDAAMLERVPAALRGRVVGLFLTIAGTFASTSPWVMGYWTDRLGPRAADPAAYAGPYGMLGVLMAVSSLAAPLIGRLGRPCEPPIEPVTEVSPGTLEAVG